MREIRKAGYVIKKDDYPKMEDTALTSIVGRIELLEKTERISRIEDDIEAIKKQIDKLSKRGEKK